MSEIIFEKFNTFKDSLKIINFKEIAIEEIKSLSTKITQLEMELNTEKTKNDVNISNLEKEIFKLKEDIKEYYPNIDSLELSELEKILDKELNELENLINL